MDDNNLFGLEDLADVVSGEDRAEVARRKEQLQNEFRDAVSTMFGSSRGKANMLTWPPRSGQPMETASSPPPVTAGGAQPVAPERVEALAAAASAAPEAAAAPATAEEQVKK